MMSAIRRLPMRRTSVLPAKSRATISAGLSKKAVPSGAVSAIGIILTGGCILFGFAILVADNRAAFLAPVLSHEVRLPQVSSVAIVAACDPLPVAPSDRQSVRRSHPPSCRFSSDRLDYGGAEAMTASRTLYPQTFSSLSFANWSALYLKS